MDKELRDFVDYLKSKNDREKAYFGIFQYGGGPDESFIKANKEGVLQFVQDLLEAYSTIEEKRNNVGKADNATSTLNYEEDWVDGDSSVLLQYLELTQHASSAKVEDDRKPSLSDKLVPIGCITIVIILFCCHCGAPQW